MDASGRTLFLGNLPPDATEREIHLLLCLLPGFEGAQLRSTARPVCFATFADELMAQEAMSHLSTVPFDPHNPDLLLSVAFARTDSRHFKRPREGDDAGSDILKRRKPAMASAGAMGGGGATSTLYLRNVGPETTSDTLHATLQSLEGYVHHRMLNQGTTKAGAFVLFNSPHAAQQGMEYLEGTPLSSVGMLTCEMAKTDLNLATQQPATSTPLGSRRATSQPPVLPLPARAHHGATLPATRWDLGVSMGVPCATLHVGSIGPNAIPSDLDTAFQALPGYQCTKVLRQGSAQAAAFVKFLDVAHAQAAVPALESTRGPGQSTPFAVTFARTELLT